MMMMMMMMMELLQHTSATINTKDPVFPAACLSRAPVALLFILLRSSSRPMRVRHISSGAMRAMANMASSSFLSSSCKEDNCIYDRRQQAGSRMPSLMHFKLHGQMHDRL
jgi:hypothetical protein